MKPLLLRIALWLLVLTVLGTVFIGYLSPHMVVDLAARVWSCF